MRTFDLEFGEKYGLIAIPRCLVSDTLPDEVQLAPDLWAYRKPPLLPQAHWREWIGSLRFDALVAADLILLARRMSKAPDVLDQDNKDLETARTSSIGVCCSPTSRGWRSDPFASPAPTPAKRSPLDRWPIWTRSTGPTASTIHRSRRKGCAWPRSWRPRWGRCRPEGGSDASGALPAHSMTA